MVGKRRADGERCCWAGLCCAVPQVLGWARLHELCRMGRCRQDDDDTGVARAGIICAGIARAAGLVQTRLSGCRLTLSIEGRAGDPARVLSLTAIVGPSLPCAAVPPPPSAAPLLVEVLSAALPLSLACLPPAKLSPPRDASFRRPFTDPDVRLRYCTKLGAIPTADRPPRRAVAWARGFSKAFTNTYPKCSTHARPGLIPYLSCVPFDAKQRDLGTWRNTIPLLLCKFLCHDMFILLLIRHLYSGGLKN
jgi:hypothetical protein